MKEWALADTPSEKGFGLRRWAHQYHSVEFSIGKLCVPHQFRIWNIASTPTCVLVREDSRILPLLRVGDTLNLKYHLAASARSTEFLQTSIGHITKHDNGKFKGHYIVELKILGSQGLENTSPTMQLDVL